MLPLSVGLSVCLAAAGPINYFMAKIFSLPIAMDWAMLQLFFLRVVWQVWCRRRRLGTQFVHGWVCGKSFVDFPLLGKERGSYFGDGRWARKKAGRVGREREKRSSSKFKLEIKLHPFHKKGVIKACSHRLQLHQRTSQKNDINYWIWWSLLRKKCECVAACVCDGYVWNTSFL